MSEAKDCGYTVTVTPIFVDVDCSAGYKQWKAGESMTLTRTRTKAGGWWVSTHGRRLCTEEMMKFQGVHPRHVDIDLLGRTAANAAVGNAMSANVLERIFSRLLWSSGVVRNRIKDKWEDNDFVAHGAHFG